MQNQPNAADTSTDTTTDSPHETDALTREARRIADGLTEQGHTHADQAHAIADALDALHHEEPEDIHPDLTTTDVIEELDRLHTRLATQGHSLTDDVDALIADTRAHHTT